MANRIYLFGSYISHEVENDIFENYLMDENDFSISNIVYERKLFNGLKNNNATFVSCPTIGIYPKTAKKSKTSFHDEKDTIYCNYSLKKPIHHNKFQSMKKVVERIVKSIKSGDEVTILIMEMHLPFQKAAFFMKKLLQRKNIKTKVCSFCPDISANVIDTTRKHTFVYKIAKAVYSKLTEKYFLKSDCFVLFTNNMADYFHLKKNSYMVLPAIQDVANKKTFFEKKDPCSMLFSGKLQEKNGLRLLLNYFCSPIVSSEYVLHVCGSGEMKDDVEMASKINKNVVFHGFLKPTDVQKLQSQCQIVFSLRDPSWFGVKYSFPSKFFEAMSLGNNVITRKLDTYDDLVDDFSYYLEKNDIETLDAIIKKATIFDVEKKAKQYNYLLKLSPECVCRKIIDFIANT